MTTAYEVMGIQDAPDGPGPLAESDRGVTLVWDGSRFVAMQPAANAGTQIRVARGGGATRVQDAPDFTGTVGAGTDGYAIVWDNAAGAFTLGTFEASGAAAAAIAAHVGESDPHTQYLLAGGSRAGATDGLQAFEDGIVTGIVRPPSDSATAVRVQNAAGTTDMLVVDTQNGRVGVLSTFSASTFNIASNAGDTYASYLSQERALLLNGYENLSPASLSNSAGFEFRLQTSLTARTAGRLSAGYTDTTDATRTSYYAFSLSVSGIFKEVLRLAGGNVGIGTATPTAILDVSAATTTNASMRIRAGVAPTSPNDGDVWLATRLRFRRSGVSEYVATGAQAAGGVATATGAWTATEQTMLQKVYDAARTFGLLT